jgi:GLPGLI family protein
MKIYLGFFSFFISFIVAFFFIEDVDNESTLIFNYSQSSHVEGNPSKRIINAILVANTQFSTYEMDVMSKQKNGSEEVINENGDSFTIIKATSNPYIFKNYSEQLIYSKENIVLQKFLVKDSTSIFKWTLTQNKKKILNYTCQVANMHYRGRNYKAYFTTDIGFNAGPWKFSGLPGTILEIKSDDGVFEIVANEIRVLNQKTVLPSPFDNLEQAMFWEDYRLEYVKKYNQFVAYSTARDKISIPKRTIEVLIED